MPRIKVLIDCAELNPLNAGGVRSYSTNICKALAQNQDVEVTLLINEASTELFMEVSSLLPSGSVITISDRGKILKLVLAIFQNLRMYKSYLLIKSAVVKPYISGKTFDIAYAPTTYLNSHFGNIPIVVTLHDIQEKDMPDNFSWKERKYRDFRTRITLNQSNSVHVSSKFIQESIFRNYPDLYNSEKFCVIPEGVELKRFRGNSKSKKRQIIFPARPWLHKNHRVLFEAIEKIKNILPPMIVLTGANRGDFDAKISIDANLIEFKGLVSEEELTELYLESFGVLTCSQYESSSLPILEGIAAGCLAIASSIPAHSEMAQALDLSLFDPGHPSQLADAIVKATKHFDAGQINNSRNKNEIEKFDWERIGAALIIQFKKNLEEKTNDN